MTITAQQTQGKASNKWLVLVAMTGSLAMIMLDQTVVTVALPSMARQLHLGPTGQQWVVNAYVLALAALVACGGKLGDLLGRATTFRAGVTVFFAASAGCGLAPGAAVLIAARGLQGVGAALMMPASAAIVINAFDRRERGRAMAIYAGISQLFLAIGPLLGGFLTETVSWRAVFWLNVPVGLAALALVHAARPENARQAGSRLSVTAVALLTGGIGLLVLGLQQSSQWSWGSPATLLTIAAGAAGIAVFAVTQLRSADPLLDLRLFARRPFLGDSLVMALVQFGLLAAVLYASLYLQELLGFSPITAGLATLPLVLGITAAAQAGGRWFDRSGVRAPVLTGLSTALAGLAAWTLALPQLSYGWQVPGMLLTGVGLGLTISPTSTDGLNRASRAERAQASGLIQTARQVGGTFGVAIIGTIIAQILRNGGAVPTSQHAAGAITAGFAVATASFGAALLAGALLLPRGRQAAAPEPAAGLVSSPAR